LNNRVNRKLQRTNSWSHRF